MFIIAAALAAVLASGPSHTAWSAEAPSPALLTDNLQKAVDAGDADRLARLIDLDRVIGNAVDTLLPALDQAVKSGQIVILDPTFGTLLDSIVNGNAPTQRAVRQLVVGETKKFVTYGVKSGAFAGHFDPKVPKEGGLFLSLGGIDTTRKEFTPGKVLSRTESSARLATGLHDHYNGDTYPLELELALQNGEWRVVNINNAADLMGLLLRDPEQMEK